MASPSKLTKPPQWWKHLRKFCKRMFHKRERQNQKKEIKRDAR